MNRLSCLALLTTLLAFQSCKDDDTSDSQNPITNTPDNKFIGVWKGESQNFWFQFNFQANLTGNRKDSDGEDDNFMYSANDDTICFTNGFPNGKYKYEFINDSLLVLFFMTPFPDTITKQ